MKMSRNQLKALIKECLIEVLTDGLGGNLTEAVAARQSMPQYTPQPIRRQPMAPRVPSAALNEAIKREAGGNSIMESIFADTAKTTLPTMLNHGDGQTSPMSSQEQFSGTPEQVFGEETASKWAHLAFAGPPSVK